MLEQIEQWIDATLESYSADKVSCEMLLPAFKGFYPEDFLKSSSYVVVDEVPKPNFPELRQEGLGGFIEMDHDGITYKNTYFIKKCYEINLALHFHELVHVLQWQLLGVPGFINRYIQEIKEYGYKNAPLEKMAYALDSHFSAKGDVLNVPAYVQQKI